MDLGQKEGNIVFKKTLEGALYFGILIWFLVLVYGERDVISSQLRSIQVNIFLVSIFLLGCVFLFQAWIWRALLAEFGSSLSFSQTIQTLFISSMGRYIPGRIWQFSSAVYLLHEFGVSPETAVTVSILSQFITIFAGLVASLPVLSLWLDMVGMTSLGFLAVAIICMISIGIAVYPCWWIRVTNRVLRWFGRREISYSYASRRLGRYFLFYLIVWAALGFAFYVLVEAVYPVQLRVFPLILASFAFAYIAGYIAIFTPGGLGVREGALVLALSLFLPPTVATMAAILSRFWMILVEFLAAALGLLLRMQKIAQPEH